MLLGASWGGQFDYWDKFNNDPTVLDHIVMFDGPSKTIWILSGIEYVSVKWHLYSDWKEWSQLYDNTKYLQAFETEGGKPISETEKLGDTYLLINDWVIRQRDADTPTTVDGNIYGYDLAGTPQDPFGGDPDGGRSISNKVSNLVNTITITETIASEPIAVLTDAQDLTLRLAYEEARRARALQTNKVGITTIGTGVLAIDTVQVFDDDGVTLLYTIVVTGEDADNRQVTYIKNYPSGYPVDPNP